jgi:hypothetical protein
MKRGAVLARVLAGLFVVQLPFSKPIQVRVDVAVVRVAPFHAQFAANLSPIPPIEIVRVQWRLVKVFFPSFGWTCCLVMKCNDMANL